MPLQSIIPPQQFELIRDRIAQILAAEVSNQYALGLTELQNINKVWIDRFVSFEPQELPAINVSLGTGDFDNESQRSSDGTYLYYIDVHVQAREADGQDADNRACILLDRILGVVRSILKYTGYRTLEFPPPSISRTTVTRFQKGLADNQDANTSKMARLEFVVRVPETVELNTAVPIGSMLTQVKLGNTDKGYRYEWITPETTYYITQTGDFMTSQSDNFFIKN